MVIEVMTQTGFLVIELDKDTLAMLGLAEDGPGAAASSLQGAEGNIVDGKIAVTSVRRNAVAARSKTVDSADARANVRIRRAADDTRRAEYLAGVASVLSVPARGAPRESFRMRRDVAHRRLWADATQ